MAECILAATTLLCCFAIRVLSCNPTSSIAPRSWLKKTNLIIQHCTSSDSLFLKWIGKNEPLKLKLQPYSKILRWVEFIYAKNTDICMVGINAQNTWYFVEANNNALKLQVRKPPVGEVTPSDKRLFQKERFHRDNFFRLKHVVTQRYLYFNKTTKRIITRTNPENALCFMLNKI